MANYSDLVQRGARGSQPAVSAVRTGALYFVTDEGVLERSSGPAGSWQTFGPIWKYAEVSIASAAILTLRATPVTLVPAPGAGLLNEFLSATLLLDATATAYVESSANLSIRYQNTTGAKASDDIEATGFIDQTTDTMTTARPKLDAIVAKSVCENQPLVLHNLGAGEYTTGTGVLRVKTCYRVWTTGW